MEDTTMMIKSILALGVSLALASTAMAADLRRVDNPIAGQYIVVLKEDAVQGSLAAGQAKAVANAAVDLAARFDLDVQRVYGNALAGFAVAATPQSINRL